VKLEFEAMFSHKTVTGFKGVKILRGY